jgi:hypothetical protein
MKQAFQCLVEHIFYQSLKSAVVKIVLLDLLYDSDPDLFWLFEPRLGLFLVKETCETKKNPLFSLR